MPKFKVQLSRMVSEYTEVVVEAGSADEAWELADNEDKVRALMLDAQWRGGDYTEGLTVDAVEEVP
jgi:homoserine acetyltransferase